MVRRAILVLVVSILQATLMAGSAQAQSPVLSDGFDSLDETRWSKGDHYLGRSYLDPNNVGANGGNLEIKLPADSLNGGEIRSEGLYGYGSYTARMKLPNAPSSITGFFLYEPPDYASEIDIEIYNDSSRKIMFSIYAGGKQTHTQTITLPFDPTSGFHDYRFDYVANSVSFYTDGKLMKSWKGGIPNKPMHLYVNAWFPTWLEGKKPLTDQTVLVDKISYTAQTARAGTKGKGQ
jgi:endo-1,3-1,4-beta-glycanase ExoK